MTRDGRTEVRTGNYIVVGGGIVGCPLVVTLFHRFLLLERDGAPANFPSLRSLDGFLQTFISEDLRSLGPPSPAQTFVSKDDVAYARGHVLGGSFAINVDQILLNSNLGYNG